jgi:hypothetical protein
MNANNGINGFSNAATVAGPMYPLVIFGGYFSVPTPGSAMIAASSESAWAGLASLK